MRAGTTIVFCAIDALISTANRALSGFPEFLEGLGEAEIPLIPVTSRCRMQLDATIRKFGLEHPFVAEGGCGVFLPEDYFHLKPPRSVRLGRFRCIPQAAPQPAAEELLEELAEETRVEVVALRGLSPRELSQNVGLPQRDAELLRQRDFDEVFFFAGASEEDIVRFEQAAAAHKAQARRLDELWSLAIGANLRGCVRDLTDLYQRSLRTAPLKIGIATRDEANALFPLCDRSLLLTSREDGEAAADGAKGLPLFAPDTWELALERIVSRSL